MLNNFKSGVAIASAAAALFSMGATLSTSVQAADGGVHCVGVNSCKGTSDCKTAKNDCKGMNACKGMGWTAKKDASECAAAGGTVAK